MLIQVQTQIESYLIRFLNKARPSRDPAGIFIAGMLLFQLSWIYLFALLKTNLTFFKDLTPLRTIQAFALILWIYFSNNPAISNGLTFTYAFFDLIWQFWIQLIISLNFITNIFSKRA
ncbi:hypothetical protein MERGE_000773 [Pneumocystis wakefieldiae]|uniref:Uncharacterized protein n=1 Tax=Pneumocystis wakefieldiae TaxID=38082 RepID=A0A899G1G6_9ASCO|nr:hypothetical protein MERGE_000773 [Pneumocystis wakefieldiae]